MGKFIPILKELLIPALPFLRGLAEFMGWLFVVFTIVMLYLLVALTIEYKTRFVNTPKNAQPVSDMSSKENYEYNLRTLGWAMLVYGLLSILLLMFV